MKTLRTKMLLGLLLGTMSYTTWAQGTIRYVNPTDIFFTSDERGSLPLDLDGNGTVDYMPHIRYGAEFMLVGLGQNASLALPATLPNLGSYLLPLAQGSTIPAIAPTPFAWVASYIEIIDPISGPYHVAPGIHTRVTTGNGGLWGNVDGYAGLQFEIDGQMHFGWLRMETSVIRTGGFIKEWAYNTVPGQSLLAGQVPEPATVTLLLASGGLVWWRSRQARRPV